MTGVEVEASACEVTEDDAEIVCVASPGVGTGLRWRVTVGNQMSPLSPLGAGTISYSPPVLSAVTPALGVPTQGGLLTILGSEFAHEYASRCVWGLLVAPLSSLIAPGLDPVFSHAP